MKFITEPDDGIYNAMNKGAKISTGDYIQYLNAGDVYSTEKSVEKLKLHMRSGEGIDVYYGDVNFRDRSGRINRCWRDGPYARSRFHLGWMPAHPSVMIHKSALMGNGSMPFDESFDIAGDYDLFLRTLFFNNKSAKYMNFNVVTMESGGVSNGSLKGVIKSNYEVLKAWHKYSNYVPLWLFLLKPFQKLFQLKWGSRR